MVWAGWAGWVGGVGAWGRVDGWVGGWWVRGVVWGWIVPSHIPAHLSLPIFLSSFTSPCRPASPRPRAPSSSRPFLFALSRYAVVVSLHPSLHCLLAPMLASWLAVWLTCSLAPRSVVCVLMLAVCCAVLLVFYIRTCVVFFFCVGAYTSLITEEHASESSALCAIFCQLSRAHMIHASCRKSGAHPTEQQATLNTMGGGSM